MLAFSFPIYYINLIDVLGVKNKSFFTLDKLLKIIILKCS